MDSPVTDILFVSSQENCPEGYTLVSECPCGHNAQLWEKVLGGREGERYICFTKKEKDGLVVEDMYIPKRSAQWVYKGYKILKHTVEGDEPMRHRQLAVKKVPKSEAKMVVADIIVCRGRDTVSKLYRRLEKINGVCICFRRVEYKPQPEAQRRRSDPLVKQLTEAERGRAATMNVTVNEDSKLAKHLEGLAVRDRRSGSDSSNGYYSPSPSPGSSPYSTSPVEYRSSSPRITTDSSDGRPRPVEEVATVITADTLASAPPPRHPTNGFYNSPAPTSSPYHQPPSSTASGPYPAPPMRDPTYPTATMSSVSPAAGGYPPYKLTPVEQSPQSFYLSYPPSQPGPPPPTQASYNTGIGFAVGGGSYPPPQPSTGYASVAGSSFMGTAFATQQSGPAPYNPFHHQQGPTPYPPPPSSSAPYPPPPSSSVPYPPPPSSSAPYPPSTTSSQNYGFNF